MRRTAAEIATQPETWSEALTRLPDAAGALPPAGQRVAVIGCGTSFYMAQAYASLRESAGLGVTDAFVGSEFAATRPFDSVLAISRSGTTTEVVRALEGLPSGLPSTAISAVDGTPVVRAADHVVILEHADEESVVQTRFATTTLALLRAHLGQDLTGAIRDARLTVDEALPVDPTTFDRFVFLGHGWTVGLANEAALKMREAALATTESYPAMEYRHGPISVAGPSTLVWHLGEADGALVHDVEAVGATVVVRGLDPMAELILIQRMAVSLAESKGLDPDHPRNLTRSVVLP
jgi:fructoselysine-6-P-deglycase FrlB-like protein